MMMARLLGIPKTTIESIIPIMGGLRVTPAEENAVQRYSGIDSMLMSLSDYLLLSSDERLYREKQRKLKQYRFFAALSDEYHGDLPAAITLYLNSSPCGCQMLRALDMRKLESHP
jgi:hypothetical protein